MPDKNAGRKRIEGKPRVIVTRQLMPSVEARLAELYDTRLNDTDSPFTKDQLIGAVQDCDVLLPTVTDRIDRDIIEAAGERLGLIANFGAGTDHIDLKTARERRIIVTNTPGVFTDDTADLAMQLIIGVPRRVREGIGLVRRGEWTGWAPSALLGRQLGGKTLGIIGMGRIGQAVAHRARAFGLKVIYHNRHRLPASVETMFNATFLEDRNALIAASDIVTLHCPATPQTIGFFDAACFARMREGSAFINTARGDLVDQEALVAALQSGRLIGAGLDVYPEEPHVDPRLLAHPNVMTLPHIGSATAEGRERSGEKIIANIRFWIDGHRPPDQVLDAFER